MENVEDIEIGCSIVVGAMEEKYASFCYFLFHNRTPLGQAHYFILEK